MPRMDLTDASAIVTGGASGIGEASARQLTALGARVVVADLQEDKGQAVASELGGLYVKCDVSSEEDGQAAVAAASEMGPLRALVNSAGIGWASRTIDRNNNPMPQDKFDFVIKVNLLGSFNMLRLSAAAMAVTDPLDDDGQRGAVVNMASVAAFDGQIGQCAYSASKGGVVGMTLPIARDLAVSGIRVCTIAPGLFATPMLMMMPEPARQALAATIPFPSRLGEPPEYASLACQILENPMLNGETIRLDGAVRMPPK
jgi:NAD(P)-dependent dehydrogenase (short-subunit alcohol dehydrogenase family)